MRSFFQQSGKVYFEEIECSSFQAEQIEQNLFNPFKTSASLSSFISDDHVFFNLRLLSDRNHFKNGAVLFFAQNPELYFEQAVIRCVAFDGDNKRFIIDDKVFGGALYYQYIQAIQWLKQKLSVKYDIEGQGSAPRKEIWEIPETVLKEVFRYLDELLEKHENPEPRKQIGFRINKE